ncbi:hypothetical protein VCHA52P453_80158 [Vibrio chagasii]|nr:hypothetical protein VCHA39P226_80028 [Vibrio chagasii]CAH7416073.1 hypothetical protein VCHA52P456_80055 [Vibrio chagasii]CAH7424120.1 hypothetical protein VCHA52P453_80158 [Vibrio chagasii]
MRVARERGAKRSGADESNEIRVNEKLKEQMRDASKRDAKRLGADASGGETSSERLKADSRHFVPRL